MTFDDITGDGRLFAVRYNTEEDNALSALFNQWNDPQWLFDFFVKNINDLKTYFRITDIDKAIYDTIDDSEVLESVIMDISPDADLDTLFRPLENNRTAEAVLGKEKGRLKQEFHNIHRPSWLRIYALKLSSSIYVVTGGAIKLTKEMKDRQHTLEELVKMEKVRRFLLENGIVDNVGLVEYINNE